MPKWFAWLLSLPFATACGQDSCFVAGTRVRCPDGDRPIEDLAVGDPIVAFDVEERRVVVGHVAALHGAVVREVRSIVAGGAVIRGVTRSHPIFEVGRDAFVPAGDLRRGDQLLRGDAERVVVSSIVADERPEPSVPVFNLTVAGAPPTFFADGVLVHNKSIAVSCSEEQMRAIRIEAPIVAACAGDRFPIRALRGVPSYCDSTPVPAVFATSDPNILVVEGPAFDPAIAVARAPGVVTVTALHQGARATAQITIEACDVDGGGG